MGANTIGRLFSVTTFGESHGPAIGCVIDGCPPGMALSEADIQGDLDRRRPGSSKFVTQRKESDTVKILSGVYEGKTTGAPIALLIENTDQRSKDYSDIAKLYRPGHADFTYQVKYGIRDPRGGGRSSARLTAATVAAGAVAKKWLREMCGVSVNAALTQMGETAIALEDFSATGENPFFAATKDASVIASLEEMINKVRSDGDSVGARVEVRATGVPAGIGSPLFERLDAKIAYAMMGINAVKGVEIGDGFSAVSQRGTVHGDEMTPGGYLSNHAGGILGGISNGNTIVCRIAVKPTPSVSSERRTIDTAGNAQTVRTKGRHDPCVGIRAVPVAEAMLALVIADELLAHRAQCADVEGPVIPDGFRYL